MLKKWKKRKKRIKMFKIIEFTKMLFLDGLDNFSLISHLSFNLDSNIYKLLYFD